MRNKCSHITLYWHVKRMFIACINELGTILICTFNIPIRQTIFSIRFTFFVLLVFI
ncbi:hypothetical protein CYPRO_0579 [Cyclonatronum proteinivorum]|uniref:Uncharacterized protein n=1 Tax=Cyclonatronum proteinivorum TaxID=1457365 RepID=A0A345UHB2_9BACT|nr:hypothetical protein CYPRO_0579 [Cyclonatronum proteinivorum]